MILITAFAAATWFLSGAMPLLAKAIAPVKAALLGMSAPFWALIAVAGLLYAAYRTNFGGMADLAKHYKPARSVLDAVSFALRQSAPLNVGASQRAVVSFNHAVQHGSSAFPPVPLGLGAVPVAVVIINHIVRQNFEEAEI